MTLETIIFTICELLDKLIWARIELTAIWKPIQKRWEDPAVWDRYDKKVAAAEQRIADLEKELEELRAQRDALMASAPKDLVPVAEPAPVLPKPILFEFDEDEEIVI